MAEATFASRVGFGITFLDFLGIFCSFTIDVWSGSPLATESGPGSFLITGSAGSDPRRQPGLDVAGSVPNRLLAHANKGDLSSLNPPVTQGSNGDREP